MNTKEISQSDLQSIFKILKVVNNKSYVLITELAKELKIGKVELADYVMHNQKLFYAENCFTYKNINVKRRLWPNDPKSTYASTATVINKSLGMGLLEVYLNAVENYRTNEWLEHQIISCEKFIYISEVDNYGQIEGYYIGTDEKKERADEDKYRSYKWRNTVDKVKWLKDNAFTNQYSFVMGGFGDSWTFKVDNAITLNKINELKAQGWTTNKFQPLANYISANG